MGLFSKFLSGAMPDKDKMDQLAKAVKAGVKTVAQEAEKLIDEAEKKKEAQQASGSASGAAPASGMSERYPDSSIGRHQGYVVGGQPAPEPPYAPYGLSWGEEMPAGENQYNFDGPYYAYFAKIFREEFPQYQIDIHPAQDRAAYIVKFLDGERTALVVELLGKSSAAYAIRKQCRSSGTPYLRYYYDVEGWWNTREYVTKRTRAALG